MSCASTRSDAWSASGTAALWNVFAATSLQRRPGTAKNELTGAHTEGRKDRKSHTHARTHARITHHTPHTEVRPDICCPECCVHLALKTAPKLPLPSRAPICSFALQCNHPHVQPTGDTMFTTGRLHTHTHTHAHTHTHQSNNQTLRCVAESPHLCHHHLEK